MDRILKVTLALLLLLCLIDMPYGYYQFVRFIAFAVFSYLAYQALKNEKQSEMILFVVLALLFQPFIKVALGREIWNIVDVIVGVGLLLSTFRRK